MYISVLKKKESREVINYTMFLHISRILLKIMLAETNPAMKEDF